MIKLNITGYTEAEIIGLVMEGLERRKLTIDADLANLQRQSYGIPPKKSFQESETPKPAPKPSKKGPHKRILSPEARERIAAAQRKRWGSKRAAAKAGAAPETSDNAA